ncbi:hypothetical protein ACTXT7_015148 [Hymenolepis weldensis]
MSDTEWEVEKILDVRVRDGIKEYLLKWVGYDESESTWEPQEYLSCNKLLREFEKRNKLNQRLQKKIKTVQSRKDVERILNAKWRGCPNSENSWILGEEIENPISQSDIVQENFYSSSPSSKSDVGKSSSQRDEESEIANAERRHSFRKRYSEKQREPLSSLSSFMSNDQDDSTYPIEKAEEGKTGTEKNNLRSVETSAKRGEREVKDSCFFCCSGKTPIFQRKSRRQSDFKWEISRSKRRKMDFSETELDENDETDINEVTVYGATEINGNFLFIIQIAGVSQPLLMTSNEANTRYPDAVIKFYESRLTFNIPKKNK